jgi:hypothetical protein
MNEYTAAIAEIDQFFNANPTLAHQRRALGAGHLADTETVERFAGEKLSAAGTSFLDRIHKEIFNSLPTHERDAITEDLELLAHGDKETVIIIKVDENGKPELTPEYLRSIGREDILEWGTDRP